MPDEINFLPEKEKEKKEKEQAKKAKPGVKFHTPKFEAAKIDNMENAFPTVKGFFNKIKAAYKNIFKPKDKKAAELESKKPVQLTVKPAKLAAGIKSKKESAELELKPTGKAKEMPAAPAPAARPMTGMPDDLGGEYSEVDVNLMPWQDPSLKHYRQLGISLLIVSIVVVAVWGTVLRIINKQKAETIEQLTNQIEVIDDQLASINAELFNQSNDIGLRQREFVNLFIAIPRWSKFLSWLEANTHKTVYYRELTADVSQAVIPVVAPNYETAVQQWLVFRNSTDWLGSVNVPGIAAGLSAEEDTVAYDATLIFKEGVLQLNLEDLQ